MQTESERIEAAVVDATRGVKQLQADLAKERTTREMWERNSEKLQAELEYMQRENASLKHERDFYMRHSTELTTQLSTINITIKHAMDAARTVAYRPPLSTSPTTLQVNANDEVVKIPGFLEEGPKDGVPTVREGNGAR